MGFFDKFFEKKKLEKNGHSKVGVLRASHKIFLSLRVKFE
jgi:hypothetical protein